MPIIWRLVKTRYSRNAFDGEGSRLYGGRWSSPGTVVAYGSESAALATLEVLVHLQSVGTLRSFSLVTADVPDELVEVLDSKLLPGNWRRSPPPAESQAIGDAWVKGGRSAVLRMPSVVLDQSYNYLLNPTHPAFAAIKVGPPRAFDLDQRLFSQ
ncbi:MAG: RES family NAD+ phosphorylase [Gemmatimonadaceae bacterium]